MQEDEDKRFDELLVDLLVEYPAGLSEYQMLKELGRRELIHLDEDSFSNTLKLFHMHFLLFHRLYHLRDRLHREARHCLQINALSIRLLPYSSTDAGLEMADKLREYYLDMSQLESTGELELEQMLDGFWRYIRTGQPLINDSKRQQALKVLGLEAEASLPEIKSTWRRLAMIHHPDRGGDEEQLKRINEAMSILSATKR
ncbi:DNA-J related domain-containing protein [Nitrincola sp. MINF-07-Sa-05]|uniref:DNA-J related domain-containing protein n=1 Tax=Nitrincola salilacus TaxID=3400273 RepID=UPI0039184DCC